MKLMMLVALGAIAAALCVRPLSAQPEGADVPGKQNVRIDHCELLGFSYATNFGGEATAQIDHCFIHHNLRDGLGYGGAIYSGAYVLIIDNEFSQNRHSLASNGALDWSSPRRVGKYLHKPGVRKTHWEFVHNRVGSNDQSHYELCAVDTHPGMDGTFVVENNLFENLRHGIGIRDGSGLIRWNLFRNFRGKSFRKFIAISISYGTHNNVPVEGCMPHDIRAERNVFLKEGAKYEKYSLGKAENIVIDGELVPKTEAKGAAPPPLPVLVPMDPEGKLGIGKREPISEAQPTTKVTGRILDEAGKPLDGANVHVGSQSTTTDAKGGFAVDGVAHGRQIVAVTKPGYQSAVFSAAIREQAAPLEHRLSRDQTPSAFLNVRTANVTHASATIAWETSKPTTGEVEYGPKAGAPEDRKTGRTADKPATAHRVKLTGLRPATTYGWRVKATDVGGNAATSKECLFATAPAADPTPPAGWGCYSGAGRALWGRTTQEAHTGKFSAFLKGAASEQGSVNLALVAGDSDGYSGAKAYRAQPGATYDYSFWAKGDFEGMSVLLTTWTTEAAPMRARQFAGLMGFQPTQEWKPHRGQFTMPAKAKRFVLTLRASLHASGDRDIGVLYVDDVQVRTGQANVIRNGGAENEGGPR